MNPLLRTLTTEERWPLYIATSTVFTGGIVLASLAAGVTILSSHFLYLPIILVAYRYPRRGVIFATGIALAYLVAVAGFIAVAPVELVTAAGRSAMFVLIAGVVSHLSQKIRSQETQYRAVLEDQTDLICRFQADGTYTFVNAAFGRFFSKEPEEIIGSRFTPEVHEADRRILKAHFAQLIPEHPSGTIEHRVVLPDGAVRWLQWHDRAFFGDRWVPVEYQSVGRDVTARRTAEEALRRSESLYRTIFETTGTGMLILEEDGTVAMANHEIELLYGHRKDELEGVRSFADLLAREDAVRVMESGFSRPAGSASVPRSFEARFVDGEGLFRDTFITVALIPGTKRQVVSVSDITGRKRAERILRVANSINQLIVHEKDASRLLEDACREFTRLDAYFNIAICLWEGGSLRSAVISDKAYAGVNDAALRQPEVRDAIENREVRIVPVMEEASHLSDAFVVPMTTGEELRGVLMVYLHPLASLGVPELDTLQVLASDLAFALKSLEIERQKGAALLQIERNMEELSLLNDHIRNPLQAIVGIADLDWGADGDRIVAHAEAIDAIVNRLDRRCLESEKVREFLRKHYDFPNAE
jgi:PAS domain S-box-containing protein